MLNQKINLGNNDIITMLSLLTYKLVISLYMFIFLKMFQGFGYTSYIFKNVFLSTLYSDAIHVQIIFLNFIFRFFKGNVWK
jgi:hypothetical protein